MKALTLSEPLISLKGEINPDCRIREVLANVVHKCPGVETQLEDWGIWLDGPPAKVLDALELIFSQDVDVFKGNKYPEVTYTEDDDLDRKKIRHRVGRGKDSVFGELLEKTAGLPKCYGSYALRMVTPSTLRKQMIATAEDLSRCRKCKEAQTCCMSTQVRKLEELKWVE